MLAGRRRSRVGRVIRGLSRSPMFGKTRLTGVRFKVPAATMSAKLANLPEGVSVARGRIEVRFDGAENALERLFALAQALGNDYVRFEELVGLESAGERW